MRLGWPDLWIVFDLVGLKIRMICLQFVLINYNVPLVRLILCRCNGNLRFRCFALVFLVNRKHARLNAFGGKYLIPLVQFYLSQEEMTAINYRLSTFCVRVWTWMTESGATHPNTTPTPSTRQNSKTWVTTPAVQLGQHHQQWTKDDIVGSTNSTAQLMKPWQPE